MEKNCGNCLNFLRHFVITEHGLVKLDVGHCLHFEKIIDLPFCCPDITPIDKEALKEKKLRNVEETLLSVESRLKRLSVYLDNFYFEE